MVLVRGDRIFVAQAVQHVTANSKVMILCVLRIWYPDVTQLSYMRRVAIASEVFNSGASWPADVVVEDIAYCNIKSYATEQCASSI